MFTTRANHLLAVAFVAVVYGFVITCPVVVANHDDAPSSEARRRPLLGGRYHPGHRASYHRRRRRDVKRGQRHAQRHRTHDERQRQPRPPSRVLPRGDEKGRRGGDDDDDDNDYDREKWRVDNDEEDSRGTKKTKKLKKLRKDKIKERERVHDEVDVAVWHDVGRLDSENIAGDNLFDPARSSSSSPSSSSLSTTYPPSPSPTETVCRSIIAVGSTRLFDDDPALIPSHHRASSSRALYDDDDYDEEFVCELYDGTTVPLLSSSRQLRMLRESLQEGTLLSAISTIDYVIPDVVEVEVEVEVEVYESPSPSAPPIHGGGDDGSSVTTTISDPSSSDAPSSFPSSRASTTTTTTTTTTVIESVTLPPGEILIRTDPEPPDEERRGGRALRLSGNRPVLAVRVTAQGDGGTVSANAMTISNKLFGTSGDAETMMSQFASCSFGRFNVAYDASDGRLSAPGVLDVTIGITLDNPRNVVRAAMQYAVEEKLGIKLPGPYGHVMFVVATCKQECGWAAYAYVGSWLSVFQGNYYAYPAVAMHEIGHNLNLGHSGGLDGKPYSDHTCLMGNPLYKDDVADMCFNPAKNYQITANGGGWYDPGRVETYSPSTGAIWQGKLVGVAESGVVNGNAEHANSRLVLKIETGTRIDLYVGFNRATGMNEDNKQASNMVTIVEANGDGLSYSTSALRATLSQGQSYSVANWRGTDVTLTVFVDTIRYDIVPGYADSKRGHHTEPYCSSVEDAHTEPYCSSVEDAHHLSSRSQLKAHFVTHYAPNPRSNP
ncbi:hypothetical protein ACHAXA_002697 [Cyclostephanos tholiformis]|uniref:Peptidase M11 gametolysin domain-containing protein n=1 Tax=Cyclostephanos tholiformis TaxID=382380 RepID=A0ABD3S028_9STRA